MSEGNELSVLHVLSTRICTCLISQPFISYDITTYEDTRIPCACASKSPLINPDRVV
jgi:hypothetical protein